MTEYYDYEGSVKRVEDFKKVVKNIEKAISKHSLMAMV